jgi:hypothetical protein
MNIDANLLWRVNTDASSSRELNRANVSGCLGPVFQVLIVQRNKR